ncbi:MAG TPA: ABC transporter substrate-binding protein, partial [Methylomirabilota bacterium]|nr:ABC transporter substrate-binding protein [Methylomirabilota bacterium]
KVKWLNIEPAAKFVALSEKRADAVPDYTTGQPFWEKAVGKDNLVRMPWSEYGFDTYSMSIFASEKTMKERAKVLRDFLEASYMGWRDVMADPKAALEIFKKRVPDIDVALIEPNMMLGLDLMKTDRYAKNGIGFVDRGKMCNTVEFINTYMPDMPRKVGCDEVWSSEYLARIDPPRR